MILSNELKSLIDVPEFEYFEPLYDEYVETLNGLNAVALSVGESIEGNLFYGNNLTEFKELERHFNPKRKMYGIFSALCDTVVEIGFNAGHSAMLGLTANKNMVYYGIDLGYHKYSYPCFEYLRSVFGDRIHLDLGNSHDVLPNIYSMYPEIATTKIGWIIDGGHDLASAQGDMENVLTLAKKDDIVLFDDTQLPALRGLITVYSMLGRIQVVYNSVEQVVFRVVK